MRDTPNNKKDKKLEEQRKQLEEYLAKGGTIKQLDRDKISNIEAGVAAHWELTKKRVKREKRVKKCEE